MTVEFILFLRCVKKRQNITILEEIHKATYGNHFIGQSLAHNAFTQGYEWPYMKEHTQVEFGSCEACQKQKNMIHIPRVIL